MSKSFPNRHSSGCFQFSCSGRCPCKGTHSGTAEYLCEPGVQICHSAGDSIQHGCLGCWQGTVSCPSYCFGSNVGRKRRNGSFACCHSSHKSHLGLHHTGPKLIHQTVQQLCTSRWVNMLPIMQQTCSALMAALDQARKASK